MAEDIINYFILADEDKCMGCKNCETACIIAHVNLSLPAAVSLNKPLKPRITVRYNGNGVSPVVCRQCEEAPCAQACRLGAIVQKDGHIEINEEKCVGCKLCIKACPFDCVSIQENLTLEGETAKALRGKAIKCDLCGSLNQDETENKCACIKACPTKALQLTNSKEHREKNPGALTIKPA